MKFYRKSLDIKQNINKSHEERVIYLPKLDFAYGIPNR